MNAAQDQKTLDFIGKARLVHGDMYDYNNVLYKNANEKIEIICKEHGSFMQSPSKHVGQKRGCPKCNGGIKYTQEEFIEKAKKIHGNKYDYEMVQYETTMKKIELVCRKHGSFFQTPSAHLSGTGCPKCIGRHKTTEEFIKEVKAVHGDRYDYSKTKYTKSHNDIIITCSKHGDFSQKAIAHLRGAGCPRCVGRDKTTEEFIKEVKAVHGDKYDYTEAIYEFATKKLKIICPAHGEFWQTPSEHLMGRGCIKCAGTNKKTTKEFIEEAVAIHGDKYDYSETKYKGALEKLKIICPAHGEFWQEPSNHLRGIGCNQCGYEKIKNSTRMSIKEFIDKAKAIHGDKYDYSKTKFAKKLEFVTITCKEHGDFQQAPSSHLIGRGCRKCGGTAPLSQKEFIDKAKAIHGDKYDYSKTRYVARARKISIICRKHGEFEQMAGNHINQKFAQGCPKCNASKGEIIIGDWLKNHRIKFIEQAQANHNFGESLFVTDVRRTFYDFLLPKHKIIIEFDGMQHFTYVDFQGKGSQKSYNEWLASLKRDDLKDELAHNSGYKVIRIPFWERDNIEDILDRLLIKKDLSIHTRYSLSQNRFRYEMIYLIGIKNEDGWEHYFNNLNDEDLL